MPAPFNIHRLSHVGLRVTDLERARRFYVDVLGFVEVEAGGGEVYLKGVEEGQHHSLVLRRGPEAGLSYTAFRVRSPEDLDRARSYFEERKLPVTRFREKGVEEAIAVEDPFGIPVVLYHDMEYTGDLGLRFNLHRGVPPVRIHHVNVGLPVDDLWAGISYYTGELGFTLTEYFLDPNDRPLIAWLTSYFAHNSHEVAIARSPQGPSFHHLAYYAYEFRDLVRLADIMASLGLWDQIERGPGRHGATRGFYLYIRDPDGMRIEFYQGDYVVLDPDKWRPIVWRHDQALYRSDFWARPSPERWREIRPVEDLVRGGMKPLGARG